jgi:hypothetical protein
MTGLGTVDAEIPEQADLMAPVTATTTAAARHFDSPPQSGRSAVSPTATMTATTAVVSALAQP